MDESRAEAVVIGGSVSDIVAAHRAGASAIGYANKFGKRKKFEPQNPAAIIEHMAELIP